MQAYIIDWLNLLVRWTHVITGVAWIGASFYFVWLDNHLLPPKNPADAERGIGGEVWSVHGGGFYHAQKFKVAPPTLPEPLHWFKWEAYTTWMSGMALLALMYWYGAEIYLIDPQVAALSKPVAILIGLFTIVGGWIIYDQLCKSALAQDERKLSAAVFVFVAVFAFVLCQLFSGRGAYMHFGAMLGTIMVGNVFFVIMPGQRDMVAATQEGREPDPMNGIRAKHRSVHNTYFTLPVLFVMISNHYATTYGHEFNWLILIVISVAGALIRVFFVARHKGKASPLPIVIAVLLIAGVAAAVTPKPRTASAVVEVSFAQVKQIVDQRCATCHAAAPTQAGFSAAPKGLMFDEADTILANAALIHQQSVVTKIMPPGNLSGMTDEERDLIDQWFADGGKGE